MELYVGIDISKSHLDVFLNESSFKFPNSQSGIQKLIKQIKKQEANGHTVPLIIYEATGCYEREVETILLEQGYPLHRAHPLKVRAFAKSTGLLAKTDKLDAKIIAEYGKVLNLKSNLHKISPQHQQLKALIRRREQLIAERTRETNRLDKFPTDFVSRSIHRQVRSLQKEIKNIEAAIKLLIKEQPSLKEEINLLTSIPGIGDLTAATVISNIQEIEKMEVNALVALVGVAPFNKDSGFYQGKRQIKGGRSPVRRALYMAAIAAIRCNKQLKNFYMRLKTKGKPSKVALIAIVRKLLMLISSILKRRTPWQEYCPHGA